MDEYGLCGIILLLIITIPPIIMLIIDIIKHLKFKKYIARQKRIQKRMKDVESAAEFIALSQRGENK